MNKLGVHTYSFAPRQRIELPYLEKVALVASALQWQRYNGPMALVCDDPFFDWIRREGLEDLYQDIHPLPEIPKEINQLHFWAAPKIYSYLTAPVGSFHIDTDAVINGPIPDEGYQLAVAHHDYIESAAGNYHYQATELSLPPDYKWPEWLRGPHNNWHGWPKSLISGHGFCLRGLNTAVFMATSPDFIKTYCDASIDFMVNNSCDKDFQGWGLMVWAEQVMLMDWAKWNEINMLEAALVPGVDWLHLQDKKKNPGETKEWIYLLSQKVESNNSLWQTLITPE